MGNKVEWWLCNNYKFDNSCPVDSRSSGSVATASCVYPLTFIIAAKVYLTLTQIPGKSSKHLLTFYQLAGKRVRTPSDQFSYFQRAQTLVESGVLGQKWMLTSTVHASEDAPDDAPDEAPDMPQTGPRWMVGCVGLESLYSTSSKSTALWC